jgi:hypothetical protein
MKFIEVRAGRSKTARLTREYISNRTVKIHRDALAIALGWPDFVSAGSTTVSQLIIGKKIPYAGRYRYRLAWYYLNYDGFNVKIGCYKFNKADFAERV